MQNLPSYICWPVNSHNKSQGERIAQDNIVSLWMTKPVIFVFWYDCPPFGINEPCLKHRYQRLLLVLWYMPSCSARFDFGRDWMTTWLSGNWIYNQIHPPHDLEMPTSASTYLQYSQAFKLYQLLISIADIQATAFSDVAPSSLQRQTDLNENSSSTCFWCHSWLRKGNGHNRALSFLMHNITNETSAKCCDIPISERPRNKMPRLSPCLRKLRYHITTLGFSFALKDVARDAGGWDSLRGRYLKMECQSFS